MLPLKRNWSFLLLHLPLYSSLVIDHWKKFSSLKARPKNTFAKFYTNRALLHWTQKYVQKLYRVSKQVPNLHTVGHTVSTKPICTANILYLWLITVRWHQKFRWLFTHWWPYGTISILLYPRWISWWICWICIFHWKQLNTDVCWSGRSRKSVI